MTWTDRLNAALALRGVCIGQDGSYALLPEGIGVESPPQALLDTLNAAHGWRRVRPQQMREWVWDFVRTVERLTAGDSTDQAALNTAFWLRLYGVVVDLRVSLALPRELCRVQTPRRGSDLEAIWLQARAVEDLRGLLDEDELLWAEYRRHVEAHIYQTPYEPQWNKGRQQPRDTFTSRYTERTYTVTDLDKRLDSVFRRYALSEHAIASDFATRLQELARGLLAATLRVC